MRRCGGAGRAVRVHRSAVQRAGCRLAVGEPVEFGVARHAQDGRLKAVAVTSPRHYEEQFESLFDELFPGSRDDALSDFAP